MIGIELAPDQPVDRLAALASDAEAAGFDAVLTSCHYNNRDPFIALSRIAAATDEVAIGPAAANPYETHPVALASRVATLDEASEGRAIFGLGAGDRSTLSNLGFEGERPLRRVLETMRVARQLFDGERVDHDGTFLARGAGLNFQPGQVPIYVGAQGPGMLRMSGKHADGVLVNASHPRDLAWAEKRIEEGLAERNHQKFDAAAFASVSVAEDYANAREAARRPVGFIAGSAPPPVLDRHDLDGERAREIAEAIETGAFGRADELVTDAMIDAFCIAGTPEAVAERTSQVLDHVDSVVFGSPLGPNLDEAISLLAAASDPSG